MTITIPDQYAGGDYQRVAVSDGDPSLVATDNPPSDTAVNAGKTDSFSRSTYQWQSLLGGRSGVE